MFRRQQTFLELIVCTKPVKYNERFQNFRVYCLLQSKCLHSIQSELEWMLKMYSWKKIRRATTENSVLAFNCPYRKISLLKVRLKDKATYDSEYLFKKSISFKVKVNKEAQTKEMKIPLTFSLKT